LSRFDTNAVYSNFFDLQKFFIGDVEPFRSTAYIDCCIAYMNLLFSLTLHVSFRSSPSIPPHIQRLQIVPLSHIKLGILKCQEWMTSALESIGLKDLTKSKCKFET